MLAWTKEEADEALQLGKVALTWARSVVGTVA